MEDKQAVDDDLLVRDNHEELGDSHEELEDSHVELGGSHVGLEDRVEQEGMLEQEDSHLGDSHMVEDIVKDIPVVQQMVLEDSWVAAGNHMVNENYDLYLCLLFH